MITALVVIALALSPGLCPAQQEEKDRPVRSIFMAAEYPGVQVPVDENVSMDIIFHNKGKTDENVGVRIAEIPPGWDARVKSYRFTVTGIHVPAATDKTLSFEAVPGKEVSPGNYESKYISSLRLQSNRNQTIAVEVKPALMAAVGVYPIGIRVSSGDAKGEAQLAVILTGTYDLEVGTASGLLSLNAGRGKPANLSFYVKNSGSAANHDIKFMSFKPEN